MPTHSNVYIVMLWVTKFNDYTLYRGILPGLEGDDVCGCYNGQSKKLCKHKQCNTNKSQYIFKPFN